MRGLAATGNNALAGFRASSRYLPRSNGGVLHSPALHGSTHMNISDSNRDAIRGAARAILEAQTDTDFNECCRRIRDLIDAADYDGGVDARDPVFSAIERHRLAARQEHNAYRSKNLLEEALAREHRVRECVLGKERDPLAGCTDASEWIACQLGIRDATEKEAAAVVALLKTPPATETGTLALLTYVASAFDEDEDILSRAFGSYRDEVREAAAGFLPMIAATLRRIDGCGLG